MHSLHKLPSFNVSGECKLRWFVALAARATPETLPGLLLDENSQMVIIQSLDYPRVVASSLNNSGKMWQLADVPHGKWLHCISYLMGFEKTGNF